MLHPEPPAARISLARLLVTAVFALSVGCETASVQAPGGVGNQPGGPGSDRPPGAGGPGISLPDAAAGSDGAPPGVVAPTGDDKCVEDVHTGEMAPLDLLLLVDTSGSMNDSAGMRPKWHMAREALVAFVRDPKSAGLGVGLQFFPYVAPPKTCMTDGDCGLPGPRPNFWCNARSACIGPNSPLGTAPTCDPGLSLCRGTTTCTAIGACSVTGIDCIGTGPCDTGVAGDTCMPQPRVCPSFRNPTGSCTATDYEKLVTPISVLPGAAPRLAATINAKLPVGGTPMGPAAQGALTQLRQHLVANPGRRAALVLVSDGLPQSCVDNDVAAVVRTLEAGRTAGPSIPTYVIGVFEVGGGGGVIGTAPPVDPQIALRMLASAGGTGMPFVLMPNDNLAERFIEALNQIRGSALACEFKIPMPTKGELDHGKVNVRIMTAGGGEDLVYVGRAERCDPMRGGWHYDVEPSAGTPTRVLTCPATCARLKDAKDTRVELRYGCRSRVD